MSNGREFDIVVYRDSSLTGQLVADGADSGGALNELVVGFQKDRGAFPLPCFFLLSGTDRFSGKNKIADEEAQQALRGPIHMTKINKYILTVIDLYHRP